MIIEIDSNSGFCFGVVEAIHKAEEMLRRQEKLYCLGDIVHNNAEIDRLTRKGLVTINHDEFFTMKDTTVLLRAHGEPPSTYEYANKNNIRLIDATCPVVLRLQKRIQKSYRSEENNDCQIVIYGRRGHSEVNGLVGQTRGKALVIEGLDDFSKIDFNRPIELYSQTTKDLEGFHQIAGELKKRAVNVTVKIHDTICRQVSHRIPAIHKFASRFDLIIFVSGKRSSNGQMLFDICRKVNPNSKFISDIDEIDAKWIKGIGSVGICGATSTPKNLLEAVAQYIEKQSQAQKLM
jgi:4-hydroxy-3-methylbut-2-en-1-yl diphosphate reductase